MIVRRKFCDNIGKPNKHFPLSYETWCLNFKLPLSYNCKAEIRSNPI